MKSGFIAVLIDAAQTVGQKQTKNGQSKTRGDYDFYTIVLKIPLMLRPGGCCSVRLWNRILIKPRDPSCQYGDSLWIKCDHISPVAWCEFAKPVPYPYKFRGIP